jgi:hypothetical protein
MLADIPEFIEDLPNVLTLAKKKNMKHREQTKPNAIDEDQYEVQRREDDDGDLDVVLPNIKFVSLQEQVLFCGDILDDDPTDFLDLEVWKGSPEEQADAIEGLFTSAEQA